MTKSCLVLVDIQYDFLPGGALAVTEGDRILPVVLDLLPRFDLVVATQDWHPGDHGSFASNQPGHRPFEVIRWNGIDQVLWPDHCVQGTRGAELVAELEGARIDAVFRKGEDPSVDSYSGFFDNGRRRATGLAGYLRERAVDRVVVVGLATDYCVKFTALDAREQGFETWVIRDACRGVEREPGDSERAFEELARAGVVVVDSRDPRLPAGGEGKEILGEGRFLRLVRRGRWEWAERTNTPGAVVIVGVTRDRHLVLLEQGRPIVGTKVLELPAGLFGDIPGSEGEDPAEAAVRELEEETGYRAERMTRLYGGPVSPGLSPETATFYLAEGLEKVSAGGGDGHEDIEVHLVPVAGVEAWIRDKLAGGGCVVDPKVFAGVWFAEKALRDRG